MKWFSKCPLLICLVISAVILSVIGRCNLSGIYNEYEEMASGKPGLAAIFLGAADRVFFWDENSVTAFAPVEGENFLSENESESAEHETEMLIDEEASAEMSDSETDLWQEEQPEISDRYEFVSVGEEYFDDALFIGDSRTQGMLEYGGLEERAVFFCKTSLTIYDLFEKEKKFIRIDDEKMNLEKALEDKQFKKIYLMLGINELGTGTAESFLRSYTAAVERLKQLQPDAVIFVQAIMNVAEKKNESDPIFNNMNIAERNEAIRTLDDGQNVFYLDVNEVVCDENGNLYEEWTFDQIHLKAKYYEVWKEYLMQKGIEKSF